LKGGRSFVVAVAALVFLAVASQAAAVPRNVAPTFTLEASNGYELTFTGFANDDHAGAQIVVKKGHGEADYEVRASTITTRRVQASFGPFGSIDVGFEPRGERGGGPCRRYRKGTFSGRIDFDGDGGFTSAHVTETKGRMVRPAHGLCIPGLGPIYSNRDEPDLGDVVFLESCVRGGGYGYAVIEGLDPRTAHLAVLNERIGRVDVMRAELAFAKPGSFRYSHDGRRATVTPPEPFSGAAELRHSRLRGDLSVPLPGLAEPVRLTPAIGSIRKPPRACDAAFAPRVRVASGRKLRLFRSYLPMSSP
jgi:hypothetical protein